jgi:fluoride exporter
VPPFSGESQANGRPRPRATGVNGGAITVGNWLTWFFTHKIVLLTVGGAVGTNARYFLGQWIGGYKGFPLGTFLINVSGSLILGGTYVVLERLPPFQVQTWQLLIAVGFCGGYTTFSTFEYETFKLIENGSWAIAALNVIGSVIAGFIALLLAVRLTQLALPTD